MWRSPKPGILKRRPFLVLCPNMADRQRTPENQVHLMCQRPCRLWLRSCTMCRGSPMQGLTYRFILGGLIVSLFAVLGDILKPKSFAGVFGAAPSVALATLSLTIHTNGKYYAATEARCMIAGA